MKTKLLRSAVVFLILLLFTTAEELSSQTPGTLSFSVATTSTGGFSPDHYLAIWLENNSAAFIKTKIRYTNSGDLDHMQTWVNKSGQNVVDAVTGSTLLSHGTITFLWNGTDVAGTVVPDGSYFVWLEMAWASSLTTGKTVNSFPFTKGPTTFNSTPASTTNFSSIVLNWTPLATGIEGALESKDFNIYPNPSTGLLNIDFKNPGKECTLQIINEAGQVVYKEKLSDLTSGLRTFDLTRLSAGVYFCTIQFPGRHVVFSLIMTK
jgi:flagellar hook assembly protein FlgD